MTSSNRTRRAPTWRTLIVCLVVAALLMLLPRSFVARWQLAHRQLVDQLGRPLHAVSSIVGTGATSTTSAAAGASPTSADQFARLERRQAELELALAAARGGQAAASDDLPLLTPRLVSARLFGPRTRRLAASEQLILLDGASDVPLDALVLDTAAQAVIDRGHADGVRAGQLALAGRAVWGKVIQVESQTATIRRPTHLGYRDLVQLARRVDDQLRPGPRALLEGTGGQQCHIRMVPLTESVEVGDEVLAAGWEGLVEVPLRYGRIARVDREPGARHWDLWMEPAASDSPRVEVLCADLNPARVARDKEADAAPQTADRKPIVAPESGVLRR
ncbi:MAG: rod shape-determining protein MreC [Planctomycetes bacterium]|nr:rod shape-determining protein MreC [Planctomycetota bacterium]